MKIRTAHGLIVTGGYFPPPQLKVYRQRRLARWPSTVRVLLAIELNSSEFTIVSLSVCSTSEKDRWFGQASRHQVPQDQLFRRDASKIQLAGNKPLPEEIFQPFNSPILSFFVSSVLGVSVPRWPFLFF
jgi:hypothetical protein